ncbi:MAG: thioredoxin family protein [Deltaproteobacteria bacterium]|nr:thioredoxin family protein [Deltaproteobacteria bacterium]
MPEEGAEEGEVFACNWDSLRHLTQKHDFTLIIKTPECPSCEYVEAIIEKLDGDGEINELIAEVTIDENDSCLDVARRLDVRAAPTLIKFRSGREVDRFVPSLSPEKDAEDLKRFLKAENAEK